MKTSRQTRDPERVRAEKALKNKKRKQEMQKRLVLTVITVAVALIFLCMQLLKISMEDGEAYKKAIASQQNYSNTVIPFRRGTILDRNGTVLAYSDRIYTLILDPSVILAYEGKYEDVTIQALNTVFGYSIEDLKQTIEKDPDAQYIRYAKELTVEERKAFVDYQDEYNGDKTKSGTIQGVWFEEDYKRVYPYDSLACTVLGFSAGDSSQGNWGLEQYYNEELTGTNGREYGYMNSDGKTERIVKDAEDGNTLVSTIDYTIQDAAEQTIASFTSEYEADNVAILCMDPNSGEILALATDKSYDLNHPSDLSAYISEEDKADLTDEALLELQSNVWKNFAVQDAYEPGSTAKPFTVAAALEENVVAETSTYACIGKKTFGSGSHMVTIKCNKTHDTVNLTESLMYSCNSAMMDIVSEMGADIFTKYQGIFGFGKQSGVDLPGETPGLIYQAENMGVTDLATNSFGQNYNVNMVQMAAAFSSLINGGKYYQPHIVKQILNAEGSVLQTNEPVLVRETVSASTCEFLKNALFETVETGTGVTAQVSGYSVGGKTGTAQKHPRSDHTYLISFVGFAPADDPQVLIYAIVDNPKLEENEKISAKMAIALEQKVMAEILPYLNIELKEDSNTTETTEAESESESERTTSESKRSTEDFRDEVIPEEGYLDGEDQEADPAAELADPAEPAEE